MDKPAVGVGVFVWNEKGEFLIGKRKGAHAAGQWSLPGGHLEPGEDFEACCVREVKEETDLDVDHVGQFTFTNDLFPTEGKHYVTLYFMSRLAGGTLANKEPDKCEEWKWVSPRDDMPLPMFGHLLQIVVKLREMMEMREAAMAAHGGCSGCSKGDCDEECETK